MPEPTEFHKGIGAARIRAHLTAVHMGKLLGITDEFYNILELNRPGGNIDIYAEKMVQFVTQSEAERRQLRFLRGYNPDIEDVLDIVTGLKRPERPRFGKLWEYARYFVNIVEREVAERAQHPDFNITLTTINYVQTDPNRFNSLAFSLRLIENGLGIGRHERDVNGFSAVKAFYDLARKAEQTLDAADNFGHSMYAHRILVGGGTEEKPNLSLGILSNISKQIAFSLSKTTLAYAEKDETNSIAAFSAITQVFNALRSGRIRLKGKVVIDANPIPPDVIAEVSKKLRPLHPINPKNLSVLEFIETGKLLYKQFGLNRNPATEQPRRNRDLSRASTTLRDFLQITDKYIFSFAGKKAKLHETALRKGKAEITAEEELNICQSLDLSGAKEAKEMAEAVLATIKFHVENFLPCFKINSKKHGYSSASFRDMTGITTGQKRKIGPEFIKRVAQYFTTEGHAETRAFRNFVNDKKARFDPAHLINFTIYNDDATRRKINAEALIPAEIIFYRKAAAADPEGFGKEWMPEVEKVVMRACKYRDKFRINHPELYGHSKV